MPETRARISTSRDPSACPTASTERGTRACATFTTVTGIGGGAAPWAPSFFVHAETRSREAMAKEIFRLMGDAAGGGKRVVYIRSGTYVNSDPYKDMRRTKEDAAK